MKQHQSDSTLCSLYKLPLDLGPKLTVMHDLYISMDMFMPLSQNNKNMRDKNSKKYHFTRRLANVGSCQTFINN